MAKAEEGGGGGMERGELRKFLKFAKAEPVNIAMALDSSGKAILVCHKRKQPRALEKGLKEEADGSKMHRFGTLTVDPMQPKLARFIINRAGSGLARKLIIALKGTGFNKVELVLEDGTPVEGEEGNEDEEEEQYQEDQESSHGRGGRGEEEEEDEDASAGQTRNPEVEEDEQAPAQAADNGAADNGAADSGAADNGAGDSGAGPTYNADENGAAPRGGPQDGGQPDPAALAKDLTTLVRQMMQVIAKDPSQKAGLAELATDAQASLKRGDLAQAAAGIDIFRQAMGGDAAPPGGSNGASPPQDASSQDPSSQDGEDGEDREDAGSSDRQEAGGRQEQEEQPEGEDEGEHKHIRVRRRRMDKSRSAWAATRQKIDKELEKLQKQIMAAHGDGEFGDGLGDSLVSALKPILESLDAGLEQILERAAKAEQREEHEKLRREAMETIKRLAAQIQSHPVILHVDANPFVPMQLGKTLNATLQAMTSVMH